MCMLVHGEAETDRAEKAGAALFSEEIADLDERMLLEVFAEVPDHHDAALDARCRADCREHIRRRGALRLARPGPDRSRARWRLREQPAGSSRPDAVLTDDDLLHGRYVVLRKEDATTICFDSTEAATMHLDSETNRQSRVDRTRRDLRSARPPPCSFLGGLGLFCSAPRQHKRAELARLEAGGEGEHAALIRFRDVEPAFPRRS